MTSAANVETLTTERESLDAAIVEMTTQVAQGHATFAQLTELRTRRDHLQAKADGLAELARRDEAKRAAKARAEKMAALARGIEACSMSAYKAALEEWAAEAVEAQRPVLALAKKIQERLVVAMTARNHVVALARDLGVEIEEPIAHWDRTGVTTVCGRAVFASVRDSVSDSGDDLRVAYGAVELIRPEPR